MYLRPYRTADFDALHRMDISCFEPPFRFSRSTLQTVLRTPGAIIWNACEVDAAGAELIEGFCAAYVNEFEDEWVGYIATLDVAPASRRRGIARALMTAVEADLKAVVPWIVLHASAENPGALELYERLGFRRIRREPDFYGPGRDAWLYRKQLKADREGVAAAANDPDA